MAVAPQLPPPPIYAPPGTFAWNEWFRQLKQFLTGSGGLLAWTLISKAGANLTDIPVRNHNDLQNKQGGTSGEFYHLTAAEYAALGGGGPGVSTSSSIGMVAQDGNDGDEGMPIPGPTGPQGAQGIQGITGIGQIGPPGWIFQDNYEEAYIIPGPQGVQGSQGLAASAMISQEADADLVPYGYDIPESNPGAVVSPAVPATTVAIANTTGRHVTVYVKGGTLTVITVGGTATGIAVAAAANMAHTIPLRKNQTIAITYTVAPTWVWVGS